MKFTYVEILLSFSEEYAIKLFVLFRNDKSVFSFKSFEFLFFIHLSKLYPLK